MSVIEFAIRLAGDVSSFTPSVRAEMQSAIAAWAGVEPSAVMVTVTSGSVIVGVRIQTPTTMATSVQSTMASATSSLSSATTMLASVTGVSIAVLAVVTAPIVANIVPPPPPPPQRPPGASNSAGADRDEGAPNTILILVIVGVLAAVLVLLCCLAMVCWWMRHRNVELLRIDVDLRKTSANTVSEHELHQQQPPACSVAVAVASIPSGSGGGAGGDGGVGIEMSGRFERQSSETERSSRADGAEGGARPATACVIDALGSNTNRTRTMAERSFMQQDKVRQQQEARRANPPKPAEVRSFSQYV